MCSAVGDTGTFTMLLLLCALFASVSAQQNVASYLEFRGKEVWANRLMFGSEDFISHRPHLPSENRNERWFILGHRGQGNHAALEAPINLFLDLSGAMGGTDALAMPNFFEFIWDDRLSTSAQDGSCWRAVCPTGYSPVGDFFYRENYIQDPPGLYNDVRCVRTDLTVSCSWGDLIYSDAGSTALYDLTVWAIDASTGSPDAMDNGFFHCNDSHDGPPGSFIPRCLNQTEVLAVYNADVTLTELKEKRHH